MNEFLATCHDFIAAPAWADSLAVGMPVSLFMAGFTGGLLHCTTMCGPNILSVASENQSARDEASCASSCSKKSLTQGLLMPEFHAGRMLSYTILAIFTYLFFGAGFAWSPLRQFLSVIMLSLAGVIFLTVSIPALNKLWPWAQTVRFPLPHFIKTQIFRWAAQEKRPFARGFLIGFMPCGLLFSALLACAASPSLGMAVAGIVAFALGTMPTLMLMRSVGVVAARKYPSMWGFARQGLMAVNGVFLITLATRLALVGFN